MIVFFSIVAFVVAEITLAVSIGKFLRRNDVSQSSYFEAVAISEEIDLEIKEMNRCDEGHTK